MYKITWDKETGGVLLHSRIVEGTSGTSPRPVFREALDAIGVERGGVVVETPVNQLIFIVQGVQ